MMTKIRALITSGSGIALIATFVIAGLTAIEAHLTGNAQADVMTVVAILGMLFHPTDMTAGRTISN
jgi:hypothetical protein